MRPARSLPMSRAPHALRLPAALLTLLLALLLSLAVRPVQAQEGNPPPLDVPYVPTPQAVVDKMLEVAAIKQGEKLYDLGSGDGRLVITAARKHGATGVGIDLNPQRVAEAEANAKAAGVTDKVEFRVGNLFEADVSDADVVTLYLLPDVNRKLRPMLWKQLRVGARVVSHDFDMGPEWPPERTERVDYKTIYYWTIKEEHKKQVGAR